MELEEQQVMKVQAHLQRIFTNGYFVVIRVHSSDELFVGQITELDLNGGKLTIGRWGELKQLEIEDISSTEVPGHEE
ncbi:MULTISPECIES: hypothetical protein [Saccharibacillus]|uniref:DUF2642 domain-containing protein n=1 Tax=Saccharibacillus brassicae TaxID=2583377 RepID=A0A4Y6UU43_SACBS|nr:MULTISPECIES: hypothetical protein [Saccharibacillus]MWJ32205.1 hypothetical protein [Saccharibacillus sp. WB 17]QDH19857.1 hypothetical protein FFV09_02630 [Saccharibacillus brassicae]